MKIIKKGYVAMNAGEFDDLQNMTFLNNLEEAKKWKGQKIIPVKIEFALGNKTEVKNEVRKMEKKQINKYRIFINSGYLYINTQEEALKKAKEILDLGINVDIKAEKLETK